MHDEVRVHDGERVHDEVRVHDGRREGDDRHLQTGSKRISASARASMLRSTS